MATTPTAKLGIPLPVAGSGEPFTVAAYNFGVNSLDTAAGFTICTSSTRPGSPWLGQPIFETDTLLPHIWDGAVWVVAGGGGSIDISSTAPLSPSAGDLWWDSDSGVLYIYYDDGTSSQWVDAASPRVFVSATAPTGYPGQLWLDSTDGSMYVYYTDPGGVNSQWIGAVSRSGGILQVVSTTKTDTFSTASTTFVDITGLSASITPRSTNSKIYVVFQVQTGGAAVGTAQTMLRLMRDSTAIGVGDAAGSRSRTSTGMAANATSSMESNSAAVLDSPATTSTITYKVQQRNTTGTFYVNRTQDDTDSVTYSRTASSITLIEVAG